MEYPALGHAAEQAGHLSILFIIYCIDHDSLKERRLNVMDVNLHLCFLHCQMERLLGNAKIIVQVYLDTERNGRSASGPANEPEDWLGLGETAGMLPHSLMDSGNGY